MHAIAGIAVALKEATTESFKEYAHQTIKNAKKLADILSTVYGMRIVSGGTDSHLMVVDITSKNIDGKTAAVALEEGGIECSASTVPYDVNPPMRPSGIRLGLSILTTIGMKESDMLQVAAYINKVLENYNNHEILSSIKNEIAKWLDSRLCKGK